MGMPVRKGGSPRVRAARVYSRGIGGSGADRFSGRCYATGMDYPVHVALQAIDAAIAKAGAPTGTTYVFSPEGMTEGRTYRGTATELREVVEDLIGAAFAIAQTHLKGVKRTNADVEALANYWKHRDEWDDTWTPVNNLQMKTMTEVRRLGAKPPVRLGQLETLAAAVLGGMFSGEALWHAIK